MSDFEKLINASDLIEWIIETDPDWCVGSVRSIIDHIYKMPSAQTETHEERTETHGVCLDTIDRQAAVDALAKMMPKSYTPDGSHPADEEIFREQEIFADCIKTLEILPSAQPKTAKRIVGKSRDGMTLWYQCDMCNEPVDAQDNFCSGCGRRLTDG